MLFAVACGLHAMRPPLWHPENSLLAPPQTEAELRRRIRVWWMTFVVNRLVSVSDGARGDFSDEDIETIWEFNPFEYPVSLFKVLA